MITTKYTMTVQIGCNVINIIALPCVDCVRKSFAGVLIYQVNTGKSRPEYAREGNLICQDNDGGWHVEYKQ